MCECVCLGPILLVGMLMLAERGARQLPGLTDNHLVNQVPCFGMREIISQ